MAKNIYSVKKSSGTRYVTASNEAEAKKAALAGEPKGVTVERVTFVKEAS